MSDTAIKIKNLSKVYKLYDRNIDRLKEAVNPFKKKYYRPFYALKNINLTVKKGEILGVIGRNGAGKSTLLKIITGVLTPTNGSCIVRGKISPLLGMAAGFNPELTGLENIYMNGTIKGFSKKEMDSRLDEILSFAEIGEYINQPVKTYSSGMNARLGFAVAINIDPEILIIDEVLSVGDELFRRKCYAKMEELFNAGCTVLYVSHNVNSVHEICSRAILLEKGGSILEGPPKMVTMCYQKLLFSKPENQKEYLEEIIQLNKNDQKKKDFMTLPEKEQKENLKVEQIKTEDKKEEKKQKAFLIPNFEPKSTIVEKNFDVELYDIHIKTLNGKRVNVLVTNEEYFLSYKVKFNEDVENLVFSWVFKSNIGKILSGVRYPGKKNTLSTAQKNQIYHLDWKFTCNLLKNTYYADIGVIQLKNNEKKVIIALYDAYVFKVQDADIDKNSESYWAVFKMEQRLENVKITNE
ncbi:MAG: ABC transporter ATP-binding protein [Candidatus Aminicenantes bacterium]|nr:ABC transporter ATP-binding protein [Candidatus Aminicenantes bacterium]